jgi:uncharacterized surface protein with fasciclin (FAS1) repeats
MIKRTRLPGYGFRVLAIAAVTLFAVACNKDDDDIEGNNNSTITDLVVNTDAFSTLETAVVKANLQSTLSGTGPYTVFAPGNDAFTASGITADVLNTLSADQAKGILLYHTLNGEVMAADVPAGPNAKVTTANGDSVFVTNNSNGVFINGVKVEQADIDASNGVIHRIGRVLMPPSGTIVETAAAPGAGFDSLVKAATRAGSASGDPTLLAALNSATLTVFAPTNAAFTQLLSDLGLNDINEIPVNTLLAVLRYHVVPGRVFSPDLANGDVTMLGGGTTTVNVSDGTNGGATITGMGNGSNKSNIVSANIMARNGVMHVIDRVLLP